MSHIKHIDRPARRARASIINESLEPRRLFAAVNWDGGGDGSDWNDPLNWNTNQVPGPADDVTINVAGTPVIQIVGGTSSVRSVACDEAILITNDATLDVAQPSRFTRSLEIAGTLTGAGDIDVSGMMGWYLGSIAGTGRLTLGGGELRIVDPTTKTLARDVEIAPGAAVTWTDGNLVLDDATLLNRGTFTVNGRPFSISDTLYLNGTNDPTVPNESVFDNAGTFVLTGAQHLTVGHQPPAAAAGAGGPDGTPPPLTFTNNGSIEVRANTMRIDGPGTHAGSFTVDDGATLRFDYIHRFTGLDALRGPGRVYLPFGVILPDHDFNFPGTIELGELGALKMNAAGGRVGRLEFTGTGVVEMNAADERVLRVGEIVGADRMYLLLGTNTLIVDYGGSAATPINTVRDALSSGYNGPPGIPAIYGWTDAERATGYAEARDLFTSFPATIAGQQVDDTAIIVRNTLRGDANLDHVVNLADFNRLAAGFGQQNRGWSEGDFNYDAAVNLADFNALAGHFGRTYTPPPGTDAAWTTRGDDETDDLSRAVSVVVVVA